MDRPAATPVLEVRGLEKDYRALRPLRIHQLMLSPEERLAIVGLDLVAAEVFTNLVVGAQLPDRGSVLIFGRESAAINDSDDWLATIDRIGIMSDRSVLLDQLSVLQNLAVPFTLELEPVPETLHTDLAALAAEVEIPSEALSSRAGDGSAGLRARLRLARAIALGPVLLLLEHPTASLPADDVAAFARVIDRLATHRQLSLLAMTADAEFAVAIGARCLTWQPATGVLRPKARWFSWRA